MTRSPIASWGHGLGLHHLCTILVIFSSSIYELIRIFIALGLQCRWRHFPAQIWPIFIFRISRMVSKVFRKLLLVILKYVCYRRQLYGGIAMGVAVASGINLLALSNVSLSSVRSLAPLAPLLTSISQRSYIWTRVCKFIWPFIIVICGIRAVLMIVELRRGFVLLQRPVEIKSRLH